MGEEIGKSKADQIRYLKILAFSGWALALFSVLMGSYILNKFHLEIIEMQRENKEFKMSLEQARTSLRFR